MKNNYTVYMHICPNGKKYIGTTCRDVKFRWCNGTPYKKNKKFYSDIEKYGWDNIEHIIMCCDMLKNDALNYEKKLIALHKSNISDFGYNKTPGGDGGYALGYKHTDATKKAISEKVFGENNGMFGRNHTKTTKDKMHENHKDYSGENNPNYGKTTSEETKQKISKGRSGKCCGEECNLYNKHGKDHPSSVPVKCVTTDISFESVTDAGLFYDIKQQNISRCCRGDRPTAGKDPETGKGLVWKYI